MNVRRVSAHVLLVMTSIFLTGATLAAYAWRTMFDSERFADRATAALQDTSVREAAAERVTDELVRREPNLLAVRPVVASAVSGVVGGNAFESLFRRGVRDVHSALFRHDRDTLTLTIADIGIVVSAALDRLQPELASELKSRQRVALLERDFGSVTGDLVRLSRDLRVLAYVLAALALAAAAGALALAADRRRAASRIGVTLVVAGVVIVVIQVVAGAVLLDRYANPDQRATAAAVWDAYMGDLRTTGWLIAGAGAALAAAVTSLIRPVEVEEPLRTAWRIVITEPERAWLRIVRALAFVAVGALVIAQPGSALRIVATLVGVYVVYKGLESILRLIGGPEQAKLPRDRPRRRWRQIAVPTVATLLVVLASAAFATSGGLDEPVREISRCNGHAELCDRPLDEISLPATHNSMSVPLPGWFAALHERPITGQLEDGIRALLVDTYYADRLSEDKARTYFGSRDEIRRSAEEHDISDGAVEAALRLRERLGFRGSGERGMYLCHGFCEVGFTPLGSVLEDIHEFLVTHPAEVLIVINQDSVTPQDFVAALDDAGLADYALEPPRGSGWPTLREMIEQDRRLIVMAENEAGAAPWYQLVYGRLTQETPFMFSRTAKLTDPPNLEESCKPNRGNTEAPLFLVNHWINTDPLPRPANAATVNEHDALLRRARTCQRSRGRRVNLLAVDFYKRGDLFEVVDTLNGL